MGDRVWPRTSTRSLHKHPEIRTLDQQGHEQRQQRVMMDGDFDYKLG